MSVRSVTPPEMMMRRRDGAAGRAMSVNFKGATTRVLVTGTFMILKGTSPPISGTQVTDKCFSEVTG